MFTLAACNFDPSVSASGNNGGITDADPFAADADPNAPDADPNAPDANPNAPDANLNAPDAGPFSAAELIESNAMGDGTKAAYVTDFAGRVYIGPSANGSFLKRYQYNGGGGLTVNMSFPKDSDHNNSNPATEFPSIGYSGCTNNLDCGPHNENLRGYMTAGVVGGIEYLILGGASDGIVEHIYMSSDTSSTLASMRYLDLKGLLGGGTKGLSTAKVIDGHVYLGFVDTGGSRPYLLDLLVGPPLAPGLDDIVENVAIFDLIAKDMPGIGSDDNSHAMIDSIGTLGGLPNFGNDKGWVHSRFLAHPPPYTGAGTNEYDPATPDALAYTNKSSVVTTKTGDILPTDRALPNIVDYKGRLFAARNTTTGPQLWRCDPDGSNCDPNEWTLLAPNTTGDVELSQFNNPANSAVTLLESTGTHLYVGFNNDNGVVIYRTDAAAPSAMTDFVGAGDCTAGAGCEGLGGNGLLGDGSSLTNNKQFLDSESIDVGGGLRMVYALVGDNSGPLNLYRFLLGP